MQYRFCYSVRKLDAGKFVFGCRGNWLIRLNFRFLHIPVNFYHPKIYANISGATIEASDSTMNFGVKTSRLPSTFV